MNPTLLTLDTLQSKTAEFHSVFFLLKSTVNVFISGIELKDHLVGAEDSCLVISTAIHSSFSSSSSLETELADGNQLPESCESSIVIGTLTGLTPNLSL